MRSAPSNSMASRIFLLAADFAGVHQPVQTELRGAVIDATKFLGGEADSSPPMRGNDGSEWQRFAD